MDNEPVQIKQAFDRVLYRRAYFSNVSLLLLSFSKFLAFLRDGASERRASFPLSLSPVSCAISRNFSELLTSKADGKRIEPHISHS